MPHEVNRTLKYVHQLPPELLKKLQETYKLDFELFGYEMYER